MLATLPIWTAVIGRILGTERLMFRQVTGLVIALAGIALVIGGQGISGVGSVNHMIGNLVMLAAAIVGGIGAVLTKRAVASHPPITVTTYGMLGGGLILLPFAFVEFARSNDLPSISWTTAGLVIFLGLIGGALGYSLYTFALVSLVQVFSRLHQPEPFSCRAPWGP